MNTNLDQTQTNPEILIAPSLLSSDFSMQKDVLNQLNQCNIDMIHFDVMDNHFVPNLTFGAKFIKDCRMHSNLPFDVHLMIEQPENSIESFLDTQADHFTIHIESSNQIQWTIDKINQANRSIGLAIRPKTKIERVFEYIHQIDRVLIMTVEPGFGNQNLIPETLNKIEMLHQYSKSLNKHIDIQVDGGINLETIKPVIKCGANILVMGSAFFCNNDYNLFVHSIKKLIQQIQNKL